MKIITLFITILFLSTTANAHQDYTRVPIDRSMLMPQEHFEEAKVKHFDTLKEANENAGVCQVFSDVDGGAVVICGTPITDIVVMTNMSED